MELLSRALGAAVIILLASNATSLAQIRDYKNSANNRGYLEPVYDPFPEPNHLELNSNKEHRNNSSKAYTYNDYDPEVENLAQSGGGNLSGKNVNVDIDNGNLDLADSSSLKKNSQIKNGFLSRLLNVESTSDGGIHIKAPFVDVKSNNGKIDVKVPLVNLNVRDHVVKVKAPLVDVKTSDGAVDVNAPFVHVNR